MPTEGENLSYSKNISMNKIRMTSVDTKTTVGLRGLAALHVMVSIKLRGYSMDKP